MGVFEKINKFKLLKSCIYFCVNFLNLILDPFVCKLFFLCVLISLKNLFIHFFFQAAEAGILRLRTISAAKSRNVKITKGTTALNFRS